MEVCGLDGQLRIFFADSKNQTCKSAVASRKDIRSRASCFAAAAELPAKDGTIDFLATKSTNCKALQHYFEWVADSCSCSTM